MQNNHHSKTIVAACMLYCFKNLLMPKKRVAHGWSSPSIKRKIPYVFCSLQSKEQKVELNCWTRKSISLVSISTFAATIPATSAKSPQPPWWATSLLSLIVSINALYNLVSINCFMSFSVPHLQLIHLSVLQIPAIWLTSQEEWGDGKIRKMLFKRRQDFTRDFNPGIQLKDKQQGSWGPGTSYVQNLDLLGHSCHYCISFCLIS